MDSGPAGAVRQAGHQGCCAVEVRGFEPLASSVPESTGGLRLPAVLGPTRPMTWSMPDRW